MKFFHLADLHLGKNLHAQNLAEDQRFVLQQVLDAAELERPDAVLLAGDIYNTSQPSGDSMSTLDWFLSELIRKEIVVYAVSGNHDSAEHLSFGADMFKNAGYYLSKPFKGEVVVFSRQDRYGKVNFYLLPYVTKSQVKRAYPDEPEPKTMDEVMRLVVKHMNVKKSSRNILVAHQFVTGAVKGDSETISLGGLDGINPETLAKFNYVALGHIHRAQKVADNARYAGTLLQYSFNEEGNKSAVVVVDMDGDGNCKIKQIPIKPLHELHTWKGSFEEIMAKPETLDYLRITLTDKTEIVDAFYKLRAKFKNLLVFTYKGETMEAEGIGDNAVYDAKTPLEHFLDFYQQQNGHAPSEAQCQIVKKFLTEAEKL